MRVLFTGGSGTISGSSVAACVARGDEVVVVNRGRSEAKRPFPDGVEVLRADVRDPAALRAALDSRVFDAVVDFLVFSPEDAAAAIETFRERTSHYVFISSASIYRKPPSTLPVSESASRENVELPYAVLKRQAEDVFLQANRDQGFPVTIVRPAHTYDAARPPLPGHWTLVDRIARGLEIAVPGEGTSLWTFTHARDLAVGLTGLLGVEAAFGEAFNITSDDVMSWNEIYALVADALGVGLRTVPVPSETMMLAAPDWNWTELMAGDLRYSMMYDNTKIRTFVPAFQPSIRFRDAVHDIVRWRAEHPDLAAPEPEVADYLQRYVDAHSVARDAVIRMTNAAQL